ncbi:non-muscle actin 6.2 [Pelomyxa schiedti]|nr:non-muscle actin 6.2 [Pelomyxa schiedti]
MASSGKRGLCLVGESGGRQVAFGPKFVRVGVRVAGFLAEVEVVATFGRPQDDDGLPDDIEANLTFPLPENAAVCGYAMDINGELVDAVVVSKTDARSIFEAEVRSHRSAGMMEQAIGNLFRLRVHPFNKGITRVVKILWSQKCVTSVFPSSYTNELIIPLNVNTTVVEYTLNISVVTPSEICGSPTVRLDDTSLSMKPLLFGGGNSWREYHLEYQLSNRYPPTSISLCATQPRDPQYPTVIVEPGDQRESDKVFFCTQLLDLGDLDGHCSGRSKRPQKALVLWDCSRSRAHYNKDLEIDVVKSLTSLGRIEITVIQFSSSVGAQISSDDITTVINFLQQVAYDGATSLECAYRAARDFLRRNKRTLCLLFSDGFDNWGEGYSKEQSSLCPIFVCTSSGEANYATLKKLAVQSGGLFLNLLTNRSPLYTILTPTMRFLHATDITGRKMRDVHPSFPLSLAFPFIICGRVDIFSEDQIVLLHFQSANGDGFTKSCLLPARPTFSSRGLVSRLWAQECTNDLLLSDDPSVNEKILELARQYHFVTTNSSLLLLESLDQYLQHHIEPPDSLPGIKREYWCKIALKLEDDEKKLKDKSERVNNMWRRRILWWKFDYDGITPQPECRHFMLLDDDNSKFGNEPEYISELQQLAKSQNWEPLKTLEYTCSGFPVPETHHPSGEETPALIFDTGQMNTRSGFGGDDKPTSIFPTVIGRPENQSSMKYGYEALLSEPELVLDRPFKQGHIENWTSLEALWHHCYTELGISSENNPLLVTLAARQGKTETEKITQLLFESFNVPASYMGQSNVLSLYASGRTTGIVLEIGDSISSSCCVFEGYPLPHTTITRDLSGSHLTGYLSQQLTNTGIKTYIVDDIKQNLCFISPDLQRQLRENSWLQFMNGQLSTSTYTLPDGRAISLGSPRYICGEGLFTPSLVGQNMGSQEVGMGIHVDVQQCIAKADKDIQKDLWGSVVLCGGTTKFTGFVERFTKEVGVLCPQGMNLKVVAPPERDISPWIGGSILASLSTFQSIWMGKEEYDESGPAVVHRKCFSNTCTMGQTTIVPCLSHTYNRKNTVPAPIFASRSCETQFQQEMQPQQEGISRSQVQGPSGEFMPTRLLEEFFESEYESVADEKSGEEKPVSMTNFLPTAEVLESRATQTTNYQFIPNSSEDLFVAHNCSILLNSLPDTFLSDYLALISHNPHFAEQIGFFFACSLLAWQRGSIGTATCILSNACELAQGDVALLRVVCAMLLQFGRRKLAIYLLEHILELRAEEPQSYRDLALALSEAENSEVEQAQLNRSVSLLRTVLETKWDPRFEQIELVALMELNYIANVMNQRGFERPDIDSRLLFDIEVDLRCVLTWNTDLTDLELIITEPSGEMCSSFNNHSRSGGLISRNFSGGYGPVEWVLKKAEPGMYSIGVKLHHTPNSSLTTYASLVVYAHYCSPRQTCLCRTTVFVNTSHPSTFVGTIKVT